MNTLRSYSDLTEEERKQEDRSAALFALVNRLGGQVTIQPEELPLGPFTLMRRRHADGTLDVRIEMDRTVQ